MAPAEEKHYKPVDAVSAAVKGLGVVGGAGLLVASIQNTLTKRNTNAWGVFTKFGGTVATFAAVGGTFEAAKHVSANLREKDDSYNSAIGGFLAGSILGLRHSSAPAMFGYGVMTAVIMSAYNFTGGSLRGYKKDKEIDDFERKEALRLNRRRPIEQTVSELGEGRGIYAPGYAERRAATIKANYGIDVKSS